MKIFDAFIYNGEAVADARLDYLKDHIDYFYILESSIALNGMRKKTYGRDLIARHSDIAHKLIYVNIDEHKDMWPMSHHIADMFFADKQTFRAKYLELRQYAIKREYGSRLLAEALLKEAMAPEDLLYFGDVDEIPTHEALEHMAKNADNYKYPLYVLGDLVDYDTHNILSVPHQCWHESYFIRGEQVKSKNYYYKRIQEDIPPRIPPDMHIIRFVSHNCYIPFDANILVKMDGKIFAKNDKHDIMRDKKKSFYGFQYQPLMFHLRSFFTAPNHYKKHIHSMFMPRVAFHHDEFNAYLIANFGSYLNKVTSIYLTLHMEEIVEHSYLKKVLAPQLLEFGRDVAYQRVIRPTEENCYQNFVDVYLPFQAELLQQFKEYQENKVEQRIKNK